MEDRKWCNRCLKTKLLSEFRSQIRKSGKIYYRPKCKECAVEISIQSAQNNKEKIKARQNTPEYKEKIKNIKQNIDQKIETRLMHEKN